MRRSAVCTLAALALATSACGGGSSNDSTPAAQTYSISGAMSGASTDGVLITLSGASTGTTTTAGGGLFSFSGLANGSYTLTPSKAGYTFTPASIAVTVNGANVTGQNFTCAAITYSISGAVSGATADGVLVSLSGASSSSATTAGGGLFSFSGLANGSYTLTPSKAGYTFTPTSIAVTVNGGNVTGQSFVAAVAAGPTYTVSGAVSGAISDGVLLTLSGASTGTTTTAGGGLFSFPGLADGSYTLTPSKAGYTFSPASISVTVSGANVTGQNFSATAITYSVSGAISGAISDGVLVTLSGASSSSTTTAGGGLFSFSGLVNGNYTLTPSKAGYTFSPTSIAVTVNGANVTGQSFTATVITYSISGAVSGATADGVLITLGGAATATTTTAGGGSFSFPGLANGTYTLTPSKAGFFFSPASLTVTVSGGNVTGQSFTASVVTYTVSGAVSGAVTNGVLITLSGAATGSTTTAGGGLFSFPGLADGTYTLTPSLAGYSFTPASIAVTVSGANQTGQDFTANSLVGYAISGTLTGPWVAGVTVTLSGAASATTQTSAGGGFAFSGLGNGTYTVTPSLDGYTLSPTSRSVTVSYADVPGQDFAASSTLVSYSVSGNVSYPAGTYAGRIYIGVVPSGCVGCTPTAGTSIPSPGSYTVRGLPSGSYTVQARMDIGGQGAQNANDPTGAVASTVSSGNVTGANLALADAAPPAPTVPANLGAFPGNRAMLLFWDVAGKPGTETATSYDLSWGTDAAATSRGTINVLAHDDAHYVQIGLTNGDVLYYKVRSRVGATLGAWSPVFGPVTVGAPAGGFTVSGTVSFSGTATGPLFVAVQDQTTQAMHIGYVASPTSPAAFSVSGVSAGPQAIFAIIDQNADNVVDAGDLSNTKGSNGFPLTVSGNTTGVSVTLPSATALTQTTTEHGSDGGGEWYSVANRVSDGVKQLAKVTLVAGKNVAVPVDIGRQWDYQLWTSTGVSAPSVGDTYTFSVEYTDGTTEVLTSAVTGVLSSFPLNLATTTSGAYSASAPLFSWTAPASPPASYTYFLSVWGDFGTSWWYPDSGTGLPSTTLQAQYNADGRATPPTLSSGSYWWNVTVQDSNGNRATKQASYIVP